MNKESSFGGKRILFQGWENLSGFYKNGNIIIAIVFLIDYQFVID